MKKKTIHFNDKQLEELNELVKLMGIGGYGEIPKALAFSVTFTLQELKRGTFVLPDLNEGETEMWFSSIKKLKKQEEREEMAEKILNQDNK